MVNVKGAGDSSLTKAAVDELSLCKPLIKIVGWIDQVRAD
jgi:hypothetical protein